MDEKVKSCTLIRNATLRDIKDLVRLHLQIFKGLFSEKLGYSYLQFFYKTIVTSPYSTCFIYQEKDRILGFVAGVCNRNKFFDSKDKTRIAYYILKNFLLFKIRIGEIAGFIRYFLWVKSVNINAELLSLIVDKDYRRQGVGSKLLEKLIDYYKGRGIDNFVVFSDDEISEGLNFYKNKHFYPINQIRQDKRNIFCLLYDIR